MLKNLSASNMYNILANASNQIFTKNAICSSNSYKIFMLIII